VLRTVGKKGGAQGILPAWLDQQLDTPFEAFLRSLHGADRQRSEDIRFDRESLNEKVRRKTFGSRLEESQMLYDSLSRRERPVYGFPPTDPCRLYSRRDLNGCPPGRNPTTLAGFSSVKFPGLVQVGSKGLKPVYDLGVERDSKLLGVDTGLFRGPKSASSSRNIFVKGTGCNQCCSHHGDLNLDPRALLADSRDSCPTAWMRMEEADDEGVGVTPNMFTECPSCSHGYDPKLPMSCLRNRDELICLMSNLNLRERGYKRDTEKIHCFLLSTDCKAPSTVSDEKLLHSSLKGIRLLGCKKQSVFPIAFGPPPFSTWRETTPSRNHARNAAQSEALGTPEQIEAFLFSPVGELQ
jgi:hypothetical protein